MNRLGGHGAHRVAAFALGLAALGSSPLSCLSEEDAPPATAFETRRDAVYRGTEVSDVDAMDGGHVSLRAPEKLLGVQCSGTFIGPNWILTARHCVFADSGLQKPSADLWIGSKDAPVWQGSCPFATVTAISSGPPSSWPVLAKKPSPVIKALLRRTIKLPVRQPGCRVLVPEDGSLDVALIDLNGIPALTRPVSGYPKWPNQTVLYGGPRSDLVGRQALCFGYGQDQSLAGESKGVLRSAKMGLQQAPAGFPQFPWQPSDLALIPGTGGTGLQSVDAGDSGGGCFIEDFEQTKKILVAVNSKAILQSPNPIPNAGVGAAADSWIEWVIAKLYARQPFGSAPVTSSLSAAPQGTTSSIESVFDDIDGNGTTDFVSWSAPGSYVTALGKGDGSFAAPTVSPRQGEVHRARFKPGSKGFVEFISSGGLTAKAMISPGGPATFTGFGPDLSGAEIFMMRGEGERDSAVFLKPTSAKIFRNNYGDGSFDTIQPIEWQRPSQILPADSWYLRVGDVDGDKRDDMVFVSRTGKLVWVALRLPSGSFSDALLSGEIPVPCKGQVVDLADVTGDGFADLVCATRDDLYVSPWLKNTGFVVPTVSPFDVIGRPWNQAPGLFDVDGDGLDDYVTWLDGHIWYRLSKGGGKFGPLRRIDLNLAGASPTEFGVGFVFSRLEPGTARPSLLFAGAVAGGRAVLAFPPSGSLQ